MKPFLACDVDFNKLKYPVLILPKIDGVRALNIDGKLVGRSGKPFKNKLNTAFFSQARFAGFDGEMVVDRVAGYGICNETTSALGTIKGQVQTRWCVFDYVVKGITDDLGYMARYKLLLEKIQDLHREEPDLASRIWAVPFIPAASKDIIEKTEIEWLKLGYEGVIIRSPHGLYKHGRCTARESDYLRLKRFMDSEIMVTHILEGRTNNNEMKRNPMGYAERSTLSENMTPNGMVGTIVGQSLQDVIFGGKIIVRKGQEIHIAPGKMTHEEQRFFFENQDKIVGKIAKYQFFPVGCKDKPRFPTFQGFRDPVDISN